MGVMRLQRFLSCAGVCSRRAAEELILASRVSIDGQAVSTLGVKVDPALNMVCVDGKRVAPDSNGLIYLAMHKPKGVLTTAHDPFGRPTVMGLLSGLPFRVYPVGRLDQDSEGLILLTNDGELANRLIHPRYKAEKLYRVTVSGVPSGHMLDRLRCGVEIDKKMTLPCRIRELARKGRSTVLEVVLKEGRKRQIRAMFGSIGHPVTRLVRLSIGPIRLGGLAPGGWRRLEEKEVAGLVAALGFMEADGQPAKADDLGRSRRRLR